MSRTLQEGDTQRIHIACTSDWDGALGYGPAPIKTRRRLSQGTFTLASLEEADNRKELKQSSFRRFIELGIVLAHAIRPLKFQAVESLSRLVAMKNTLPPQVEVSLSVLSGRDPFLHLMSRRKIARLLPEVFDNVWLNEGYSSGGWKERKTRQLINEGKYVLHVEDDLEAALRMARVHPAKVRIYLISNASNRPELLQKSHVILPENVVMVDDYSSAIDQMMAFISALKLVEDAEDNAGLVFESSDQLPPDNKGRQDEFHNSVDDNLPPDRN